MTTVVTALYGDYDTLRPQVAQDIDCDWICFTDSVRTPAPAPWTVVSDSSPLPPNLAAKRFKCCPPFKGDVVWIDANMQVTSPTFAREALASRHDGLATFRHPRRDCIYDEAQASIGAESQGGKYDDQPIAEQVEHYRSEGYPQRAGLFACGTLAWDLSNDLACELGQAWFGECERWSIQDQISLPVVARRLGVIPGVFPLKQIEYRDRSFLANRWLRIYPHK